MVYIARESLLCSLELTVETQNFITYGLITSGGTEIDKQNITNLVELQGSRIGSDSKSKMSLSDILAEEETGEDSERGDSERGESERGDSEWGDSEWGDNERGDSERGRQ